MTLNFFSSQKLQKLLISNFNHVTRGMFDIFYVRERIAFGKVFLSSNFNNIVVCLFFP